MMTAGISPGFGGTCSAGISAPVTDRTTRLPMNPAPPVTSTRDRLPPANCAPRLVPPDIADLIRADCCYSGSTNRFAEPCPQGCCRAPAGDPVTAKSAAPSGRLGCPAVHGAVRPPRPGRHRDATPVYRPYSPRASRWIIRPACADAAPGTQALCHADLSADSVRTVALRDCRWLAVAAGGSGRCLRRRWPSGRRGGWGVRDLAG